MVVHHPVQVERHAAVTANQELAQQVVSLVAAQPRQLQELVVGRAEGRPQLALREELRRPRKHDQHPAKKCLGQKQREVERLIVRVLQILEDQA